MWFTAERGQIVLMQTCRIICSAENRTFTGNVYTLPSEKVEFGSYLFVLDEEGILGKTFL